MQSFFLETAGLETAPTHGRNYNARLVRAQFFISYGYRGDINVNCLVLFEMSASKRAKELGVKSLAQVAKLLNLHPDTLANWHKIDPQRFDIVVMGCVVFLEKEK